MQKFFGCETIDGEARFAFCHIYMWSSFFNLGKISPSLYTSIHTYVIGHYIPLSQHYDLASHTAHVVSINFLQKWRDLQSNVDSEWQIFEKLLYGRYICSQSFCQKFVERKLTNTTWVLWEARPHILTEGL